MARLTRRGKTVEVEDGSKIKDTAEKLGVEFACEDGVCGICMISIKKGRENLSNINEQEEAMGIEDKNTRLACQCKIKKGEVEFEY